MRVKTRRTVETDRALPFLFVRVTHRLLVLLGSRNQQFSLQLTCTSGSVQPFTPSLKRFLFSLHGSLELGNNFFFTDTTGNSTLNETARRISMTALRRPPLQQLERRPSRRKRRCRHHVGRTHNSIHRMDDLGDVAGEDLDNNDADEEVDCRTARVTGTSRC
jgi:hypothetical protein